MKGQSMKVKEFGIAGIGKTVHTPASALHEARRDGEGFARENLHLSEREFTRKLMEQEAKIGSLAIMSAFSGSAIALYLEHKEAREREKSLSDLAKKEGSEWAINYIKYPRHYFEFRLEDMANTIENMTIKLGFRTGAKEVYRQHNS